MEEEAVSTEACGVSGNGGVGRAEGAGDLSQSGSFADETGDRKKQIASAEPVEGGEGGGAEAVSAMGTAEVLESTLVCAADVMAVPDEAPVWVPFVEAALGIGAEGGLEAPGSSAG